MNNTVTEHFFIADEERGQIERKEKPPAYAGGGKIQFYQ